MIAGAAAAYVLVGRRRQLTWGATRAETDTVLPGDALMARVDLEATRAVSVHAPTVAVWPWIAQLGQGRGGFYSYDLLENLVGADIHNADRIVAGWQGVAVGDEVNLAAEMPLTVAVVERGRALVLRGEAPRMLFALPYDFTWSFVLVPGPDGSTRLLVRERYTYLRPWARLLVEPVEIVSFLMTQKMMRGIRARAECCPAGSA